MQKQKQEKVLLKCIVKDCNSKVLVTLKTVNIEDSVVQFFNMCKKHKLDFNTKIKEIKEYYKNKLNNKFIKDISTTVVNKYNKKIKE